MKYAISRPIGDTSLNGVEYLLEDDQLTLKTFSAREEAFLFIKESFGPDNGITDDQIEDSFNFEEVPENYDIIPQRYKDVLSSRRNLKPEEFEVEINKLTQKRIVEEILYHDWEKPGILANVLTHIAAVTGRTELEIEHAIFQTF